MYKFTYPVVRPLSSVANPNIYDNGTSAYNKNMSPLDSVLEMSPRLLLTEAMIFDFLYIIIICFDFDFILFSFT